MLAPTLLLALASTATSAMGLSIGSLNLGSPVSFKEIQGMLQNIKTYGSASNWPQSELDKVAVTLALPVQNYQKTPDTPVVATPNCTISTYDATAIQNVLAVCTNIVVKDLTVPGGTTLDLSKAKSGSIITFEGKTTWGYANANWDMLKFGGNNITVQGAPSHVIDGNGAAWWDGIGSNGGVGKPNHMIVASKVTGGSVFKNLYIKNAPTHVWSISGGFSVEMRGIVIDMKDGYAILPSGLEAGHNTDGYDVSSSTNMLLTNNVVFNQDDCVAVTSGGGITVNNFFCNGGHGLSIGSVGGKSNNTVNGVTFSNSQIYNSQNGARIKANSGTTGSINDVTYENIVVGNISIYGIDIQQDYLNGGPTGIPTNGVSITNIKMKNIVGTAQKGAYDYYILVGNATTADTWSFSNIAIKGAANASCNVKPAGFSCST